MKKYLAIVFSVLFMFGVFCKANAEQFVLACKIKVSAVNMQTEKVMKSYFIDRYFIVDTVLEGVYDENNNPLDVNEFNDHTIVFTKKAISFADIVDTRFKYNRDSKKITLNEIYGYSSKFDQRAQFYTKGEGTCSEIKIKRKALF